MQWCQTQILPMIKEANISYNLIQTGNTRDRRPHKVVVTCAERACVTRQIILCVSERQNHARELIREISLPEWDGIVIVSGDGLLHEVGERQADSKMKLWF